MAPFNADQATGAPVEGIKALNPQIENVALELRERIAIARRNRSMAPWVVDLFRFPRAGGPCYSPAQFVPLARVGRVWWLQDGGVWWRMQVKNKIAAKWFGVRGR